MKKCLHIIFFVFYFCASAAGASVLDSLDRIIAQRHLFEADKRLEIDRAQGSYSRVTRPLDRYNTLRKLYEAYRDYRIDSALIVADMRLEIARALGDRSKVASASINLAEAYVRSGQPDAALEILDSLGIAGLQDYHLKYRNSVYRGAWEGKLAAARLSRDVLRARDSLRVFRDRTLNVADSNSQSAVTLQAERMVEAGMPERAVAIIEEGNRRFDFSGNAAMQYKSGEIYLAAGMRDRAVDCLARSAMLDLVSGRKEYSSLILLASILFEEGEVERAFEYINCAFEDADFSKANLRTAEIMNSMPVIDRSFHQIQLENTRRTRILLAVLACVGLLMLLTLILLVRTLRANRRMLVTIEGINGALESNNALLKEADALKLRHINTLMKAHAGFITRLRDERKTHYRLMAAGQYEKVMDALKSDRGENRDAAVFHAMFDEAFLSMFPDFPERVNALLTEPLKLRDGGTRMSPELRVLALMKLGITSTDEIAEMLHISAQSVYNLRSSIRAASVLSKADFEAAISEI
ncbi:MAG: hypothetical protein K2L96_06295 [Muribaculaceae bacterium]|nr:hypothetical protein [Muribaculaceae bacterium]